MASTNYELRDIKQGESDKGSRKDQLPEVVIVSGKTDNFGRPIDKHSLVFIILLIHGVGTLMPWNMFINAEDYFRNYKLASPKASANGTSLSQVDEKELSDLRQSFLSWLGLASQLPNVLFNGLNLIVNMGSGNLMLRVNLTLIAEAVIFLITIILAIVDSSQWPRAFFYITLLSVAVLNMASGIYQNCIFGTGAKFPGTYTNAILTGSNISGTFTSTVALLSIWLAPEPQVAAIYYFITALVVIFICLVSYNYLPHNSFFRHHDQSDSGKEVHLEIAHIDPQPSIPQQATNNNEATKDEIPDTLRETVDAMVPKPKVNAEEEATFMSELNKKWIVLTKCWPQCLNVFLTFYITLALFPAILVDIKQVGDTFSEKYFCPFNCFFLFNFFAMIGNVISNWTTWPGKDRVWILVVARVLFVPLFLFCNYSPNNRTWPILIKSDSIYIIANILLAASSGYLSSLCMMFASSGLKPDEAPKAGMLAAFFLVFGIFSGINSSFILRWIVNIGH